MKKLAIVLGLALILPACERTEATPAVGTEVRVEKKDGVKVAGKLVEVKPEQVVLQAPDGTKTEVLRSQIASMTTASGLVATGDPAATRPLTPSPKPGSTSSNSSPISP